MTNNPNAATLQTGLGRASRRTGNRLDRLTERTWMIRQQVTFPYGAVPAAISFARTYYARAVLLGAPYLLEAHGMIAPGFLYMLLGAYLLWELILGAYVWMSGAPKFDLAIRVVIAVSAMGLVYSHLYEGICRGSL